MLAELLRFEGVGYTAISIKVVLEESEKVKHERERLLGIAKKFINFLAIPSKPFALVSVRLFRFARGQYTNFVLRKGQLMVQSSKTYKH